MSVSNVGSGGLRITKLLEEIRKYEPDIYLQTVLCFVYVAQRGSIQMKELADMLDVGQSSVSRNVAALSKVNRHRRAGLDWIAAEEDPMERRRKIIRLTPKGKRVWADLKEIMESV